jgi:hypothetical protein
MTPIEWLLSGDTGVSSKTICAVMTGSKMKMDFGPDIPHDGGDFGRCYRLLQHFPEWRVRLHEMADKYPMWGPMVEVWDELSALYEKERDTKKQHGLYERMRELVEAGRISAGWKKTGPHCWQGPGVQEVCTGSGVSFRFGR